MGGATLLVVVGMTLLVVAWTTLLVMAGATLLVVAGTTLLVVAGTTLLVVAGTTLLVVAGTTLLMVVGMTLLVLDTDWLSLMLSCSRLQQSRQLVLIFDSDAVMLLLDACSDCSTRASDASLDCKMAVTDWLKSVSDALRLSCD